MEQMSCDDGRVTAAALPGVAANNNEEMVQTFGREQKAEISHPDDLHSGAQTLLDRFGRPRFF